MQPAKIFGAAAKKGPPASYKKTGTAFWRCLLFGADDGTFVAASCALQKIPLCGIFCAGSAAAPLPQKSCAFSGTPVLVGSSPHHIKKQAPPCGGACFLVRMMGLEPTGYCYH